MENTCTNFDFHILTAKFFSFAMEKLTLASQNVCAFLRDRIFLTRLHISASYRPDSMNLSLIEILEIEKLITEGNIRMNQTALRNIKQLKSLILFFHEVFPDSDPWGTQKYSLKL